METPTSTGTATQPEPLKPWRQVAEESNIFSLPPEQRLAEYDKWSSRVVEQGIRNGDFDSRETFNQFKLKDIRTRKNLVSDDIIGPSDDEVVADYNAFKSAFASTQAAFSANKPTPQDEAIQGEVLQGKRKSAFVRGQMFFNPAVVNDPQKYREAILESDAPTDIKMFYAGIRPEMEKSATVTRRRELASNVITRDVADKVVTAIQEGTELFGMDIGTPQSPALKKNKDGVWSVVDPEYVDQSASMLDIANARYNPLGDSQYKPLPAINEYQKKYGLTDEQVQQDYMESLIENAPTTVNRWLGKATSIEDYVKQLDSTVRVKNKDVAPEVRVQDPNLFFDPEGYNAAVDKANAPDEAKTLAKAARTQFADAVAGDIYNNLLNNRDDFREDYAKDVVSRGDMEKAITRYYKDKKDQAWYDDVGEVIGQAGTAVGQGLKDLVMMPSAIKGMFGDVEAAENYRYHILAQQGEMQAEEAVANRTGGAGFIKLNNDVMRIIPDLVVQMGIAVATGGTLSGAQASLVAARTGISRAAATTALRQAAVTGEKAALKSQLLRIIPEVTANTVDDVAEEVLKASARTMSNNPFKGGIGTQRAVGSAYAGLTSAASTFGQVYTDVVKMGKSPEEAIATARTAGVVAGAITSGLTHSFGMLGRGGVEDFASMGRKAGEFTIKDIVNAGLLDSLTTQEGRQLMRNIAKGISKDALSEGAEEGLDQALNLISQYATNPSPEAQNRKATDVINESLYGGLLGIIAGGGTASVGQARATAPGITAQQMQAEIIGAQEPVAPDVAPPVPVAPNVAPVAPTVQPSVDPVVQEAKDTVESLADIPDTSQTAAALAALANAAAVPKPEFDLPGIEASKPASEPEVQPAEEPVVQPEPATPEVAPANAEETTIEPTSEPAKVEPEPTENMKTAQQTPKEGRFSIYQSGGRWLVQQGEKRGVGDYIFSSQADAEAEAARAIDMERKNAAFSAKQEAKDTAEKAAQEEKEKPLNEYLDAIGATPMQRGKLKASLKEYASRKSVSTGKTYQGERIKVVRDMVNDGYAAKAEQVDAIQPLSGSRMNIMDNRQQAEFEKRRAAAGKKTQYMLSTSNGGSFVVTKSEYDYAKWIEQKTKPEVARDTTKPEQMTPEGYKGKAKSEYLEGVKNGERLSVYVRGMTEDMLNTQEIEDMRKDAEAAKGELSSLIRAYRHGKTQGRINRKAPVFVEAVDAYGITLPPGYVKQGELYVYQPEQQAQPTKPDAVQKPSPDAGVLRQEGQEVGLSEVDQGGRGAKQEGAGQEGEAIIPLTEAQISRLNKIPELEALDAQRRGLGFNYPTSRIRRLPGDPNVYVSRSDKNRVGVTAPDGSISMLSAEESALILDKINAFEKLQEDRLKQDAVQATQESQKQEEKKFYRLSPSSPVVRRLKGKWINHFTGKSLGNSKNDQRLLSELEDNPNIELYRVVAKKLGDGVAYVSPEKAGQEGEVKKTKRDKSVYAQQAPGEDGAMPKKSTLKSWRFTWAAADMDIELPGVGNDIDEARRSVGAPFSADAKKLPDVTVWDDAGSIHIGIINRALAKKEPVSSEAIDLYEIKLPNGYVKDGDLYVYEQSPEAKPELTPEQQDVVVFIEQEDEVQEEKQKIKKRITPGKARKIGIATQIDRLGITSNDPESVIAALEKITNNPKPKPSEKHHIRIAKDLLSVLKDSGVKIQLVSGNDARMAKHDSRVNGWYDPKTNTAYINLDGPHELGIEETILHELVHASGEKVIQNPQTEAQERILGDLGKQMLAARKNAIAFGQAKMGVDVTDLNILIDMAASQNDYGLFDILYGVSSLSEYHAHATTSRSFQKFLATYKEGGKRSLFERFVNSITRMLSGVKAAENSDAEKAYATLLDLMREGKGDVRKSNTDTVQSRARGVGSEQDSTFVELERRFKAGDKDAEEEARKLIEKIAKEQGWTEKAYHGTPGGGFTVFDIYGSRYGLMGQGAYFTNAKDVAQSYADKQKRNVNPSSQTPQVYEVFLKPGRVLDMEAPVDKQFWLNAFGDYLTEDSLSEAKTNEDAFRAMEEGLTYEGLSMSEGAEIVTDGLMSSFDSVTHIGGKRMGKGENLHNVTIVFNSEQIKSADPFTYDDNGNLILPSERFQPESPDIRFSRARGIVSDTVTKYAPEFNVVDDKDGPSVFFDGRNVTVNPSKLEGLDEYEVKDLAERAVVAAKAAPKDPIAASIIQQTDGYSAYNFDSATRKEIRKSLAKAHAVATENGMAPLAMDLGAKLFEYGGATDADVRKSMARGDVQQYDPKTSEEQTAFNKATSNKVIARNPQLAVAAVRMKNGEITAGEYADLVDALDPFTAKGADPIPTDDKIKQYIQSDKVGKVGLIDGAGNQRLQSGSEYEFRIDIPTYNKSTAAGDTVYAITTHLPVADSAKAVGEVVAFSGIAKVKDPKFMTRDVREGGAITIAKGAGKFRLATVKGNYEPITDLPADINDPNAWTEVGYNPIRSSYFVDTRSKDAVVGGSEAIMVGSRVFVKNAKLKSRPTGITMGERYSLARGVSSDADKRYAELESKNISKTITEDEINEAKMLVNDAAKAAANNASKPFDVTDPKLGTRYRGIEGYGIWMTPSGRILPVDNHSQYAKNFFGEKNTDYGVGSAFGQKWIIVRAIKGGDYRSDNDTLYVESSGELSSTQNKNLKDWAAFHGYEISITKHAIGHQLKTFTGAALSQRFNLGTPVPQSRARGTELVTRVSGPALAWKKFISGFRSRGMVTEEAYEIFSNSNAYKREIASFISFIGKDFSSVANKHFGEGEENWLSYRIFSRDATGEVTVSKTGFKTAKEAESFAQLNRIKDYTVATGEDLMNRALGSNGPTLSENVREKIEQLTKKGLDDIAKSIAAYKEEYLDYWNLVMLETQADMVDAKQIATLRERKQQWMKALQLRAAEQRQIVDDARKEAVRVALEEGTNRIIAQQQFAKSYLPDDLVHQIERSRAKIDELSGRLTKIEWLMDGSQLQMIIDAKTGVYVTRSYEAFETNDRVGYVNWLDEAYRALYDPKQDYDPLAKERIMPLVRHLKNNIIERRIEDLKLENEQRQVDEIMADLMTDPRQVTQVEMVPEQSTEGTEYEELVRAVAKRELLRRRSEEKKDFIRRAMRSLALNGFASNIRNARKRLPVLRKEANRLYDQRYPEQVAVAGIMGTPNALRYTLMTDDEAHDIANTERAISENPGSVNGSEIWTASISGEKHSSFYAAVNDDFRRNLDFITGAPSSKTGFSGATANDWKRLGDKILEHKNDVPAFLRTFLGERDNPLLRVSDTLLKQSHLIAVGELYQNLAKTGMAQGWIVDRSTLSLDGKKYAGWKTILDSEKTNQGYENNPFSGKYIDPVMADAINVMLAANQPSNTAFKAVAKFVGFALWGVTAGSVKAIIRNLLSAPSFLLNSGFLATILDPRRLRSTAQNVALASIVMQESMSSVAKVSGGKKIDNTVLKGLDWAWTGLLTIAASQRTATGAMKGVGTVGEFISQMKSKPTSEAAQQFYSLAVRLGVANDNVQKEAMERLLSLEETISRQPRDKNLGRFAKALKLDGVVGFGSYLLSTIKSAGQQRSQLYGAPDDFTKILAWLNEMDSQARIHAKDTAQYNEWKGADGLFTNMPENLVKLAADHTTDTIQSHSKVWAHITQFKKAGFGVLLAPFVAARAEFYRNAINSYRIGFQEIRSKNTNERAYGITRIASAFLAHTVYAKAAGIALSMIFKAMADDDDVAEDSPEKREAIRKLGPEYAKNKNATYVVYKNGTFDWLDISFSDPFSFVSSSLNAARRGIDEKAVDDHVAWSVAKELMAENFGTFVSPQIAVGATATMISGYDPVRGIKIWDSQADTTAEKVQKAIAYYAKQAGTPGDVKSAMNIIKAARGIEENGRQYKLGTEIGGVFLGASVRTIKVTDMVEQKLAQAKDNLNTRVGALYEAQLRDSNDVDMDDVVAATETYHRVGQDAIRRMQKVWKAGETLLSDTPGGQKMLNAVMESDKVKMNAVTERAIKTGKNVPSALSPQTEQKVGDLGKKHGDDRLPVTKDTLKRLNQKP